MGIKPNVIKYERKINYLYWMREVLDENGQPFKNSREIKKCTNRKMNWVIWCPSCSAGARLQDWKLPTGCSESSAEVEGVCPHCGQKLLLDCRIACGEHPVLESGMEYEQFFCFDAEVDGVCYVPVELDYKPLSFVSELRWWPMSENGITFEVVYNEVSGGTMYEKYWKYEASVYHRVIFSRKTGLVYSKRPCYGNGKFAKTKVAIGQNPAIRVLDSLYGVFPEKCQDDVLAIFVQEMSQAGYDVYFRGCSKSSDWETINTFAPIMFGGCEHSINELGSLFYWRDCPPDKYKDFYLLNRRAAGNVKAIKRMIPRIRELVLNGEVSWLPKYMQKPSIRKRLLNRASLYYYYKWMYALGVRDVNIMNAVADAVGNSGSIWEIATFIQKDNMALIKHHINNRPASCVSRFLTSMFGHGGELIDARRLFFRFIRMEMPLPENPSTIHELHDALTREWNRLHNTETRNNFFINRSILYSDKEHALETQIENLKFSLPADTDTLRRIGSTMHICVGSYDTKAINKDCTIVYVTNTDREKLVACIELQQIDAKFRLEQCKSYCNNAVEDEIVVIEQWLRNSDILFENNYDYRRSIRAYNCKQMNVA